MRERYKVLLAIIMVCVLVAACLTGCSGVVSGNNNSSKYKQSTESGNAAETSKNDNTVGKTDGGQGNTGLPVSDNSAADKSNAAGDKEDAGNVNADAADSDIKNDSSEKDGSSALGDDNKNASTDGQANKTKVVVLDPGHGGCYSGASYSGLTEKYITLTVSNYARDYLLNNYENVEVYLTREKDTELDVNIVSDLELRCEFAKTVGADCLVSIHFNASEGHKLSGTEIYCSRRDNVSAEANALAECVMEELVGIGLTDNGIKTRKSNDNFDENGEPYDYYAINRHCANRDIPGIIAEQCFMDNSTDVKFLQSEEDLRRLGEANARGIAKYLGLKAK